MREVDREAVVVGGGILGLMVAVLLAEEGRQVDVFVSPQPEPRSDSQRNHSWLQSGLLYPGNIISRHMYYDGLAMLDHFFVTPPAGRGIFRFSSKKEAEGFLAHAREIKLLGKVEEIPDAEALRGIGVFYQPGCFHFRVPDAPFPEAQVMELARSRARLLGVRFYESRVEIEPDPTSETGYVLVTENQRVIPRLTVICAGAGTPRLLESLKIQHTLVVNQSVLLVIYDVGAMRVPLLADRTSGLTVVAWGAKEIPPRGRLVVGAGDRRELALEEQDVVRRIKRWEQDFLIDLLPPELYLSKGNHRFTAGQKTDVLMNGKSQVAPWIHSCENFPGLIFAIPGKATLAFSLAQGVLDLANPNRAQNHGPFGDHTTGSEVIHSHHHPEFDNLNDGEEED